MKTSEDARRLIELHDSGLEGLKQLMLEHLKEDNPSLLRHLKKEGELEKFIESRAKRYLENVERYTEELVKKGWNRGAAEGAAREAFAYLIYP